MLEFHRKMLADTVRNDAFYRALQKVIVSGETTVADIGSGTGLLSFLACKLGAKECYLFESGDVFRVGKHLAEANEMSGLHFVHKHSSQVKSPPRVDVVVSETLGNYALEEHLLENMEDARERFLKPGGTLIPGKLTEYIAPVVTDRLTREIDTWGSVGYGLDLTLLRDMTFHNVYVRTVKSEDLLAGDGAVQVFDAIDFSVPSESQRTLSAKWKISDARTIHGFALWWEAELAPGVILSTSPSSPLTHWEQVYLPLLVPLIAEAGDALLLSATSDTRYKSGLNLTWKAQLFRGGKAAVSSQKMDMKRGFVG